jgi:hypothetical protein
MKWAATTWLVKRGDKECSDNQIAKNEVVRNISAMM